MIVSGGVADRYFIFPLILMMLLCCNIYTVGNDKSTFIIMILLLLACATKIYIKYEPSANLFSETSHPSYQDAKKTRDCLENLGLKNTLFIFNRPWDGTELSYYATILKGNVFFMPNNIGQLTDQIMKNFILKYSIDSFYLMHTVDFKNLLKEHNLDLKKVNCGLNIYVQR